MSLHPSDRGHQLSAKRSQFGVMQIAAEPGRSRHYGYNKTNALKNALNQNKLNH
ncbi:hypothetical protein [Thalassoporum mexicanum]|uniref:hypothetical protein n=1 Tax=Thalassoporum mexicanum TaxID=3457544 RepID=UPI0012EADFE2|nr:hypothetical protein [Pseudanabaena sp. PCC 7367]